MVTARGDGPTSQRSDLDELKQRVESLWQTRIAFYTVVGTLGVVLVSTIVDAFTAHVLPPLARKYLGVVSEDELEARVPAYIWKEMEGQVATSFGAAFTLGTAEEVPPPDRNVSFFSLPFFGPEDMKNVWVCYRVTQSGSAKKPAGIVVRLDNGPALRVIEPTQGVLKECIRDELTKAVEKSGSTGSNDHDLQFQIRGDVQGADRKDLSVIVSVLGQLPGRK